jgi:hypothetical protein
MISITRAVSRTSTTLRLFLSEIGNMRKRIYFAVGTSIIFAGIAEIITGGTTPEEGLAIKEMVAYLCVSVGVLVLIRSQRE